MTTYLQLVLAGVGVVLVVIGAIVYSVVIFSKLTHADFTSSLRREGFRSEMTPQKSMKKVSIPAGMAILGGTFMLIVALTWP